jgi:hypothetical protein
MKFERGLTPYTTDNVLDKSGPKPTDDHMVILVSMSPTGEPDESLYEMDEPYSFVMHQGLKRDIKYEPLKTGNRSMQDGLPLFEKYQFLSPGKSSGQHAVKHTTNST